MRKHLPLLAFIFYVFSAKGQQQADLIEKNPLAFRQENMFIHLDKQNYLPNETIWLKAYLTNNNSPNYKSTTIKIELINKLGEFVAEKVFPIVGGTANGNIQLPKNLPAGNYLLRAYTKWMMQFPSTDFYQRNIVVGLIDKAEINNEPVISFYPESGSFINGSLNFVGYTCTNKLGEALQFSSAGVISNDDDTVLSIKSTYQGIGKFAIIPTEGKTYKAFFIVGNKQIVAALPNAKNNGTILSVSAHPKGKYFSIEGINEKPAFVMGHVGENIVFKMPFPENNHLLKSIIPTNDLQSGIMTIAVFSSDNKLLAQRQTFINNKEFLMDAQVKIESTSQDRRGKNVLQLSVPDSLEGIFSVSITDADKATHDGSNIVSTLLLHDHLLGWHTLLKNPFEGSSPEVENKIDLLMLTSKPKQYDWQELLKGLPTVSEVDDSYITLEGIVSPSKSNKILPDAALTLIVQTKDSSINYLDATADKEGKFMLKGLLFEDTATIFYQGNAKKLKDKQLDIKTTSASISSIYKAPLHIQDWLVMEQLLPQPKLPQTTTSYAVEYDTSGMTIKGVTVTTKKKTPSQALDDKYSTGMFRGNARTVMDFINDPPPAGSLNIFQYLVGRYSYLQVSGNMPNYQVQYRNTRSMLGGPVYMNLYLDEMPADASTISTVPMNNIAMVKILTNGFQGVGGAIAVYTKKLEDGGSSFNTNLNKIKLEGYSTLSIFSSPAYGTNEERFIKNDNRTTLYWNPNISLVEDTKSTPIRFYNSDSSKRSRIVIHGTTSDGKLFYYEKVLEANNTN